MHSGTRVQRCTCMATPVIRGTRAYFHPCTVAQVQNHFRNIYKVVGRDSCGEVHVHNVRRAQSNTCSVTHGRIGSCTDRHWCTVAQLHSGMAQGHSRQMDTCTKPHMVPVTHVHSGILAHKGTHIQALVSTGRADVRSQTPVQTGILTNLYTGNDKPAQIHTCIYAHVHTIQVVPVHAHIVTWADFHRCKDVSVYRAPLKSCKSHTCTRMQGID